MRTTKNERVFTEVEVKYQPTPLFYPVNDPETAHKLFREVWDESLITLQEQVYVIFLNGANQPITWRCLHTGGTSSCIIDQKLLLILSLKCLAAKIIIAHNHPSGALRPSKADLRQTQLIKSTCAVVDIELADHLILTTDNYFSFQDHGYL